MASHLPNITASDTLEHKTHQRAIHVCILHSSYEINYVYVQGGSRVEKGQENARKPARKPLRRATKMEQF